MRHIIIKASELTQKIDFTPTLIFGFYGEHQKEAFLQTAQKIKAFFGDVALIACSSSTNVLGKPPYREEETVLCLMDLRCDAFSVIFSSDKEQGVDFSSGTKEDARHALLLYAGNDSWVHQGFESMQEQLKGGGLFGAVAGASDVNKGGSLYYEGAFYEEGILGCLIDATQYDLKGAALHDFEPSGIELFVTKAEGNRIIQIEDEPALSMIESIIGTITPNRLAMFDTPFFIKNGSLKKGSEFSLTSLQNIDRSTKCLQLSHNVEVGSRLKVAIPISNRSMKRRLWRTQKKLLPTDPKGALMLFFSSSSLPSHWHEMEVLYMMNMIDQVRLPFIGLHTLGEIAPLPSKEQSTLRDQTLTVISLSERSAAL